MGYIDLKYRPTDSDLVCDFHIEPEKGLSVKKAAEHVAGESSVGTWTPVHTNKPYLKGMAAKVFSIQGKTIKVAYPQELFEPGNVPQILSSVAGNIFGMKAVDNLRLNDIDFPSKIIRSFKGPLFGVSGVRKLLGVKNRPLVGTIVKPKIGLKTSDHAKVAYDAWVGGCDIVKDDENLTSQSFNPFKERIEQTLKARDKAEKEAHERKVYMPNVTAETNEMLRRAKMVADQGGEYVMIDIITCGWSALQTLRDADLGLVIHAHRAMHGALTRDQRHGVSMLALAKLSRLIGVDQLHIGTVVGKMVGGKQEVIDIEEEMVKKKIRPHGHVLEEDWLGIKPVFPVCSGGLNPVHVPELTRILGQNIIIQMGGGIHGHPDGTVSGAKAARQAIEAVVSGISLKEYSKRHPELAKAVEAWGQY